MIVYCNVVVMVINGVVVWIEYVCYRVIENFWLFNGELKVDIGMRERDG